MRLRAALALAAAWMAGCGDDDGTTTDAMVVDAAIPDAAPPFSIRAFDNVRITSVGGMPNFQQAVADIDFGRGPFAEVKLVVDLSSTCYPFESWTQPPPGQRWPADCDAFDRNFEFLLDDPPPPAADGGALPAPAIEVLRAITPFGGPLHLEADLTDLANGRPGAHKLKTFIATWSDGAGQVSGSMGGWNVSARIEVTPGAAPRRVVAVIPLYNGSQGQAAGEVIGFDVPAGVTRGRVEYRTTGHGGAAMGTGCIGPAEEFCRRMHTVTLDGAELARVEPWRNDCHLLCTITHQGPPGGGFDYCKENPCGAIGSVRAPRANWCPGSQTPPYEWEVPALGSPGHHTVKFDISTVVSGGSWRSSAVYFGYAD